MSGSPFDLLVSAALMVDSPDETVAELHTRIGLPLPDRSWKQDWPGWGYCAWWCRLQPSLRAAPTRLEVNGKRTIRSADRRSGVTSFMAEMAGEQEARPLKTHANVVGAWDLKALEGRLERAGVERYVDPPSPELPYPRTWIGRRGRQDRIGYRGEADAGLRLEILPLTEIGLPAERLAPAAPAPDLGAAAIARITRRQMLTDHLEGALARLERDLGWSAEIDDSGPDRRAALRFTHPLSASIELIEPRAEGPRRELIERHGPGPHRIVLGVADLDAKAEDLRRRATPFVRERAGIGEERLVVRAPGCAALFEFEKVGSDGR